MTQIRDQNTTTRARLKPTPPPKKRRDITGQRFGLLVAIKCIGAITGADGRSPIMWRCRCDCGKETTARAGSLTCNNTRSCGCIVRRGNRTTHGESAGKRTPEYRCWSEMQRRCFDPRRKGFEHYGARGITVCDRWRASFEAFLADMGRRPSTRHSIDRKDNNGNYDPSNCRWATKTVQMRNTSRNVMVTMGGVTRCVSEWLELHAIPSWTYERRVRRGWSPELAIATPPTRRASNRP